MTVLRVKIETIDRIQSVCGLPGVRKVGPCLREEDEGRLFLIHNLSKVELVSRETFTVPGDAFYF